MLSTNLLSGFILFTNQEQHYSSPAKLGSNLPSSFPPQLHESRLHVAGPSLNEVGTSSKRKGNLACSIPETA